MTAWAYGNIRATVIREFLRFYKVDVDKNQRQLHISTEVSVEKSFDDKVIEERKRMTLDKRLN